MTVADLLLDCLELCKCTRIAMDVYHQCQLSDNYGFIAKVGIFPDSMKQSYFIFLWFMLNMLYNLFSANINVIKLGDYQGLVPRTWLTDYIDQAFWFHKK